MADDEKRPLLFKIRSNQRSRASTPSSTSSSSTGLLVGRNDTANQGSKETSDVKSTWQVRASLTSILIAVVFERLTYYGITGNLVLFLNEAPFLWESYHAISASFLFFGLSYIMSLVGGWISDSLLGRFRTIVISYGIYLCGCVLLPFLAWFQKDNTENFNNISLPIVCAASVDKAVNMAVESPFEEQCAWLIFITLVIIAVAAGVLKANICPFGADQLVLASQQTQLSFFNLFYWCVNFGSFLGLGIVAYIQQEKTFLMGFVVCAVSLGCSAIVFVAGRCCYICRPRDGSILTNIAKIIHEAWRNKRRRKHLHSAYKKSVSEGSRSDIDEAAPADGKISFLDYAKHCHGGSFHNSLVDDMKKLGMIMAVFSVLIPYWLVYFQMQTTFLVQGLHMKLDFSNVNWSAYDQYVNMNKSQLFPVKPGDASRFKVVAAWFSLCDITFVIILLPLFDRVIYPRMARAGRPFTFSKRIVLGMLFAMASMVVAGVVEQFRLKAFWANPQKCINHSIDQTIGDTTYHAADMSVFWQIPQYALIGISEVFASVACLQFAVTVAPKSMKAAITGLFYFFSGIASFLGIALVLILAQTSTWFSSGDYGNINCGCPSKPNLPKCHLDYYFFMLASLEVFGLILFLVIAKVYNLNSDESVLLHTRFKDEANKNRRIHVQRQSSI